MKNIKNNLCIKNRNLGILVLGQIISLFGSSIQRFALSLYVLDMTGSGSVFASILAFSMIPIVLLAPIAGVIADRLDRKKVMVILDFISSAVIIGYAALLLGGYNHVMFVGILMFLLSGISTIYQPAVTSSIPDLAKEDELLAANGIVQQVSSLSNFLGPIIAGVLYGLLGIQGVIWINGISFFLSAILELFLKIPRKVAPTNGKIVSVFLSDIKESGIYLKHENPVIFRMIFTSGLYNLFLVPVFSVGAPYIIKITLGMSNEVYGLAEGVIAMGMILGAMIVSMRPKAFHIKTIHQVLYWSCFSMLMMGVCLIAPKTEESVRWLMTACFTLFAMTIMLVLGIANVISAAFIQKEVPNHMLGKISAYGLAFATFCVPLGQLIFGGLLEVFSEHVAFLVMISAVFTFGVTLIVRWNVKQIPEEVEDVIE